MAEIDFNKWSVLKNLDKEFVKQIKCVYVFGINGDQVIVITIEDMVYAFGSNKNGCLGLGHNNDVQQPTLIPQLCQKQISIIEFGGKNFVMALTLNGSVYSWGNNSFGQLCNGNTNDQTLPVIIESLNDEKVIDIKTGKIHAFILTSTGKVYRLGYYYNYTEYIFRQSSYTFNFIGCNPTEMRIEYKPNKLISISSGLYHSLALTDNGDVYQLGDYAKGKLIDKSIDKTSSFTIWQCDLNNYSIYSYKWSQIEIISDVCITKISCGPYHSILLSNKGIVYCFGANNRGQCGDGTNEDKINPTKVKANVIFVDIGATKNYDISIALAYNGFCYVWGKCGDRTTNKPIKTGFTKINDAIEFYSSARITYEPINLKQMPLKNSLIMDRISEMFNNREYSDIAFKVEDKLIYAQKTHLTNVCKHFKVMLSEKNWIESNTNEIEITNYSYSVYYAFIKYLYTDFVDIKAEDSLELLDLANCYLDEELKKRCALIIKEFISNENVIAVYLSAFKFDCKDLKKFCIEYFRNNKKDDNNIEEILENAAKELVK